MNCNDEILFSILNNNECRIMKFKRKFMSLNWKLYIKSALLKITTYMQLTSL